MLSKEFNVFCFNISLKHKFLIRGETFVSRVLSSTMRADLYQTDGWSSEARLPQQFTRPWRPPKCFSVELWSWVCVPFKCFLVWTETLTQPCQKTEFIHRKKIPVIPPCVHRRGSVSVLKWPPGPENWKVRPSEVKTSSQRAASETSDLSSSYFLLLV